MSVSFFVFMFSAHGPDGDDGKEGKGCDFKIRGFKDSCENKANKISKEKYRGFYCLWLEVG